MAAVLHNRFLGVLMKEMTVEAILSLARNFMESRILLSGAEIDVFTILVKDSLSAEEICGKTGSDERALTILLDALAAMGFLVKEGERYRCPQEVSALLGADAPGSILPMVLHTAHLWHRWSNLTALVHGTGMQERREEVELRAFIGAMHAIAAPLAPRIVAAIDPGSSRALLDVGGGSGTYTIAFLEASPQMKATLFDRPPVIEMARERLAEKGMLERVALVPGDFYRDDLPGGHDLALLSAIIHQNSPRENLALFQKIYRALVSGGRIVIRDHVMSADRTRPRDGAIFAVNMLMGTSGGNTYTYDEIESWLKEASFTGIRLLKQGEHMDALVEGFKP